MILSLLVSTLTGVILLHQLLKQDESGNDRLLSWVLALPVGMGLQSLLLFYAACIAPGKAFELSLTLNVLGLAAVVTMVLIEGNPVSRIANSLFPVPNLRGINARSWETGKSGIWLTIGSGLLLTTTLIFYWYYFWSEISQNVLGGWDARYFWNLKARFYFRDPVLWKGMFSSLLDAWGHPDYPLLLPGVVAWGWFFSGKELIIWPIIVSLIYGVSMVLVIFWALKSLGPAWLAALGAAFYLCVPVFHFWSTTQYADIPLSLYMTTSIMLALMALRHSRLNYWLLSGLCGGLAVWTKDEGYFFLLALGGVLFLTLLIEPVEARKKILKGLLLFALGAALPVLASLIVKTQLGTTGGQYVGSGRGASDFFQLLFGSPAKTQLLAGVFGIFYINMQQWNGLWIIFLLATLVGARRGFHQRGGMLLLVAILIQAGYFAILHVTPYDLKFQIKTALLRIMSHGAPIAFIYACYALGRCLPDLNSKKA